MKNSKKAKCILIVSIKGGTGKTLIAANLAFRLADSGKNVAAIDADITSPNLAEMMGVDTPLKTEQTKIYPAQVTKNLKLFSMSLLAEQKPISMEGMQTVQLLTDIIHQAEWGKVDYFVLDLPAGSSDQFKGVVKIFANNLIGSIIVVQPAHKIIAERCIKLHLENEIPIIGLIENMSYLKEGTKRLPIFGKSIVTNLGKKYQVQVLGKIPLAMEIREAVEKLNGQIPEEMLGPIYEAIKIIEVAKPQRPGFLQRIKERARGFVAEILAQIVLGANKEVKIPELQEKYGYPGNRYIQFNILDKTMNFVLASANYIIRNGKLLQVRNPPHFDTIIEIRIDSLAHIFLQDKQTTSGIYDLQSAYYMGHARVWGKGETIRGLHFMREVWNTLREEPSVTTKLRPLFKHFA